MPARKALKPASSVKRASTSSTSRRYSSSPSACTTRSIALASASDAEESDSTTSPRRATSARRSSWFRSRSSIAATQCREPCPAVNPGRPVHPVMPGRPRDGKQGAVSHPAETLHEDILPAPPPPVIRRNHVGTVSLLCAVGGAVACNLALAGPLPNETWL